MELEEQLEIDVGDGLRDGVALGDGGGRREARREKEALL